MPSTANLTPLASILSTERVVATTAAGDTVSVLASGMPVSTAQAAADAAVLAAAVQLTGAQTVAGVKTFSSSPVVPGLQFSTTSIAASALAAMRWNDTDKCHEFETDGGVMIQIGQETVIYSRNASGVNEPNGAAVILTGSSGQRATVALARADALATCRSTIGLVTTAAGIADNGFGFVTTQGLVRDLDTSAFTEGAELWLSTTTAGGYSITKPSAEGQFVVRIGFVVRSHATQGSILVAPHYHGSVTGDAVINSVSKSAARIAIDAAAADLSGAASQAVLAKKSSYQIPLVILGDSIANVSNPPAGYTKSWADFVMADSAFAAKVVLHPLGISSDTLASQHANRAALLATLSTFPVTGILVIAGGHNDANAGASLVSMQLYVAEIAALVMEAGWRVVLVTPPSVGNLVEPKLSIRNQFQAWELSQTAWASAVVDTTGVDEGDTIDGTHPTATANQTLMAPAFIAAVGPLLAGIAAEYNMGQLWHGTSQYRSHSLYEPAIDLDFIAGAASRIPDEASPFSTGLRMAGQNWRGVASIDGRGAYVGDGAQTVATLASTITLTGDFTVIIIFREAGRAAQSGSNSAPILTSATGDSIGLAGGTGIATIFKNSAGENTNYTFPELPTCSMAGRPMLGQQTLVIRRNGSLVRAYMGNRRSSPQTITGDFVFDRLFGRSSGTRYNGDIYEILVKENDLTDAQIDEFIHSRDGGISKGVNTALWLRFDQGRNFQALDLSTNRRHALFPAGGSTWHWLFPRRESTVRGTATFAGAGNAQLTGQVCTGTDDVVASVIIHSSGSANITIGTASAGAQIAASQAVVSGLNKIVLTANPLSSSGSLWIGSDAAATLKVTATVVRADV